MNICNCKLNYSFSLKLGYNSILHLEGLREWSLITGRGGGLSNGRWGGGKSFSHAEGEHKRFWGSFHPVARGFSHIVGGRGRKTFPLFKRGGGRERFYPVLGGGAQQVLDFSIL